MKRPTISPLSEKGWFAVNTVIGRGDLRRMLPTLRKLAQGLVIHEPQQILSLEEFAGETQERDQNELLPLKVEKEGGPRVAAKIRGRTHDLAEVEGRAGKIIKGKGGGDEALRGIPPNSTARR